MIPSLPWHLGLLLTLEEVLLPDLDIFLSSANQLAQSPHPVIFFRLSYPGSLTPYSPSRTRCRKARARPYAPEPIEITQNNQFSRLLRRNDPFLLPETTTRTPAHGLSLVLQALTKSSASPSGPAAGHVHSP